MLPILIEQDIRLRHGSPSGHCRHSKTAPGTRVKADTFIAHQTSRFRLMTS
jgi:hypothetical protein